MVRPTMLKTVPHVVVTYPQQSEGSMEHPASHR